MFTGSGIPMRFASQDGTMIDVYQAATQMTDESGQSYPYTIDALLDAATGPEGYYGAFCANMHTDYAASPGSDAIIASAQAHGVPVLSGSQELAWLDGRNGSSFGSLAWDKSTGTMSFTITTAPGADGLQAMLPLRSATGMLLSGIMYNGVPIPFTTQLIKGVQYGFFAASAGSYRATYSPDTTPPSVAARRPPPGPWGSPPPLPTSRPPSTSRSRAARSHSCSRTPAGNTGLLHLRVQHLHQHSHVDSCLRH